MIDVPKIRDKGGGGSLSLSTVKAGVHAGM